LLVWHTGNLVGNRQLHVWNTVHCEGLAVPVLERFGLGRGAGRGGPESAVLGARAGLDLDQYLLEFPDQLVTDLLEAGPGDDLPGERDLERLAVPGGRLGEPGGQGLPPLPGPP